MKHTLECWTEQKEFAKHLKAFEEKYPNYCRHCGGWGVFVSQYDPSPAGISLGPGYMLESDPCPKCMENGDCPLCGHHHEDEDWGSDFPTVCESCGWTEDTTEGAPDIGDCGCYLLEETEDLLGDVIPASNALIDNPF
jgi:hypothetical protein